MSLVVSNPAARTQPDKSPDSTTRQPGSTRQPGNPATRQHPAAPGSTRKCAHVLTAWQNPAAPGSTRQHLAAPRHPAAPGNPALTRQHPGNPATRPGNTRQPGNQGSSIRPSIRLPAPMDCPAGAASAPFYVNSMNERLGRQDEERWY